jgi:hypothetical protein
MTADSAKQQFEGFLSRYTPEIRVIAKAALSKMRKLVPGAIELVYDNYNALVIGFGPTERASDAIFSLALYPRWVTLFFLQGASLPDRQKLLKGSGKVVRQLVLEDASTLDSPAVKDLIGLALKRASTPMNSAKTRGRMVIKSISPKQRPRRPKA